METKFITDKYMLRRFLRSFDLDNSSELEKKAEEIIDVITLVANKEKDNLYEYNCVLDELRLAISDKNSNGKFADLIDHFINKLYGLNSK